VTATVTDHANGVVVTVAMVDGGFDPVAIGANVGDTLGVDIATSSPGTMVQAVIIVAARRAPRIVRTRPPSGGHDVPLNSTIVVVFSEPIDSATLAPGVLLARNDSLVPGGIDFADSQQVSVAFQPSEPLAALTTYQLDVTRAIRDLNGIALDSAAVVTFTTGTVSAATGLTFATVSAGTGHTCAVTTEGTAYCWGYNANGQLGDGTATTQLSPVAVAGGLSLATVSAGSDHTCGLTPTGAAYCWGYNGSGALGDGTTTTDRTSPVAVGGGLSFGAVSLGVRHTCGVTPADAVYCWGLNAEGQLGVDTGTALQQCGGTSQCSTTPVAVGGGLSFTSVSAGYTHTCGVTTAGAAYCWGANSYGQLGDGTTTERTSPVAVAGGVSFAAISAGVYHTCGLTTAGAVYCWGSNIRSQLGIGTATGPQLCDSVACSLIPVAVAGGLSFATLSAGGFHTCGVTPAGAAYCWGDDRWGALGNGTNTDQTSPVAVAGGLSFAEVSAAGFHTCGVTPASVLYCWGANNAGELGVGTTTPSYVPVKVAGQP